MFNNQVIFRTAVLTGMIAFLHPCAAFARQTIVLGSVDAGFDYWERDYDAGSDGFVIDQDAGDKRDYFISPEIELQSRGIHDLISLRYSPVFRYDDLDYSTETDHYLDLRGERSMTRNWDVAISDIYVLSDDSTRYGSPFVTPGIEGDGAAEQTGDEITQNLGRRRYWTNDLLLTTGYKFAEESDVGVGYGYRVLRNESDDDRFITDYAEYDRHQFKGFLTYMFNPFWESSLEFRYVNGQYEDQLTAAAADAASLSRDLEEYWVDLGLDKQSVSNTFPVLYRFRETRYEDLRPDITVNEMSFGWRHTIDQHRQLSIGAGPSYIDSDDLDGEWGFNGFADYTMTFQHGSITALVNKMYEPRNFTGSSDSGLTDLINARVDATYQLTKEFASVVYGQYRHEDIINPQGAYFLAALGDRDPMTVESVDDVTYSRESFSAGVRLEYSFLRWFVAALSYRYFDQEGDLARDSYSDHRILFSISASKELWRR